LDKFSYHPQLNHQASLIPQEGRANRLDH